MIERPIFIVAPPRSGAAALYGSLSRAPGVFTAVGDRPSVFDAVYELNPANRDWDSHRLTAADARPRVIEELRSNLKASLCDRAGNRPGLDATWAALGGRNAPDARLACRSSAAICPDAYFVYVHREPRRHGGEHGGGLAVRRLRLLPRSPGMVGPTVVAAAGARLARAVGQGSGGDRRRAVDRNHQCPARRSREPRSGALVRRRPERPSRRPPPRGRAGVRLRRDRGRRGRHPADARASRRAAPFTRPARRTGPSPRSCAEPDRARSGRSRCWPSLRSETGR